MKIVKESKSLCPICQKIIPMTVYEENGVIWLKKKCPEHGEFEDVYWGDAELYYWFAEWDKEEYVGSGVENPRTKVEKGCPFDCGLCPNHKTYTILGIIDVTNRCNLRCPVCFAHAGATGYVYEPSFEQVVEMMKNLRANKPWPCNALQFSGGEPTMRNDLPELVAEAKRLGFRWVCVDTNGIRVAEDIEYFKALDDAGLSSLYLQFDSTRPEVYLKTRGRDILKYKLKVIENARKLGFDSIVLVVTLAKGVNDQDMWDIIKFAAKNSDVIRCVNVQPISFAGRARREELRKMRITIPDFMKLVEEQSGGVIKARDFRPVNWPVPFAKMMSVLKNKHYPLFTAHPHCGSATFILVDRKEDGEVEITPITKVVDVDKLAEDCWKIAEEYKKGVLGKLTAVRLLRHVKSKVIRQLISDVIKHGSYKALGKFMRSIVMIGCMHFMDVWNFDLQRVERCCIHYAVPDGRIISFCTFNNIHRPEVEKKFAIPVEEWEKKTGKKVDEYA